MADFDAILNAVIPWVIGFIGIYILYRPLKEPLAPLFSGIGSFIISIKKLITGEDREDSLLEEIQVLEYE